jgi:hypothetical protein
MVKEYISSLEVDKNLFSLIDLLILLKRFLNLLFIFEAVLLGVKVFRVLISSLWINP